MIRTSVPSIFAAIIVSCGAPHDFGFVPTAPSSPISPSPAPPTVVAGTLTSFIGTYRGHPMTYRFTAPADCTLFVRLTWPVRGRGPRLRLKFGDIVRDSAPPEWSPVTVTVQARAGQEYVVTVDAAGAHVGGEPVEDPFEVTISRLNE